MAGPGLGDFGWSDEPGVGPLVERVPGDDEARTGLQGAPRVGVILVPYRDRRRPTKPTHPLAGSRIGIAAWVGPRPPSGPGAEWALPCSLAPHLGKGRRSLAPAKPSRCPGPTGPRHRGEAPRAARAGTVAGGAALGLAVGRPPRWSSRSRRVARPRPGRPRHRRPRHHDAHCAPGSAPGRHQYGRRVGAGAARLAARGTPLAPATTVGCPSRSPCSSPRSSATTCPSGSTATVAPAALICLP